jgi:hypothetical protein
MTAGYGHIPTRGVVWADDPDIPGFKQKILHQDDASGSVVRLWFIPPGWGEDILRGKPDRHYHKTVIERGYHLYGDFPHWEFADAADHTGSGEALTVGMFMDRPVLSLHGLQPEPVSQAGAVILYWNTGRGTSIREPGFELETINVPFNGGGDWPRFNAARLVQTLDLPWQAHDRIPGWKCKPLAAASHGSGAVSLVHIPTDWTADEPGNPLADQPGWLYVVHGDLRLQTVSQDLRMGVDDFLEWASPEVLTFGDGPSSDAGCTAVWVGGG